MFAADEVCYSVYNVIREVTFVSDKTKLFAFSYKNDYLKQLSADDEKRKKKRH